MVKIEAIWDLLKIFDKPLEPDAHELVKSINQNALDVMSELERLKNKFPPPTLARFIASRPMFKNLPKLDDFKDDDI